MMVLGLSMTLLHNPKVTRYTGVIIRIIYLAMREVDGWPASVITVRGERGRWLSRVSEEQSEVSNAETRRSIYAPRLSSYTQEYNNYTNPGLMYEYQNEVSCRLRGGIKGCHEFTALLSWSLPVTALMLCWQSGNENARLAYQIIWLIHPRHNEVFTASTQCPYARWPTPVRRT